MNEYTVKAGSAIPRLSGSEWIVAGIGDFDGDGLSDIMWRNTQLPRNRIWLMDGLSRKQGASIRSESDLNWTIIGAGTTAQ